MQALPGSRLSDLKMPVLRVVLLSGLQFLPFNQEHVTLQLLAAQKE
jgi:hypothetical protein